MLGSRSRTFVAIALAAALGTAAGLAAGSAPDADMDSKSLHVENSRALPSSYQVTLILEEGGETYAFSTVTAGRHFELSPPERRLDLQGSLQLQHDGRELLDFRAEFQQRFVRDDAANEGAFTRVGNWKGSAYLDTEGAISIFENPNSKLTVSLKRM